MAQLRIFLGELHQPKGELRELRSRLGDAERELPRTLDAGQRARVVQDVEDLATLPLRIRQPKPQIHKYPGGSSQPVEMRAQPRKAHLESNGEVDVLP
jgi:hypothetical protein